MSELLKALQIFLKYGDPNYPTHCEHDILWVCGYSQEEISAEDTSALDALGFYYSDERGSWVSMRFGSA